MLFIYPTVTAKRITGELLMFGKAIETHCAEVPRYKYIPKTRGKVAEQCILLLLLRSHHPDAFWHGNSLLALPILPSRQFDLHSHTCLLPFSMVCQPLAI